jgi:hypothetical protein
MYEGSASTSLYRKWPIGACFVSGQSPQLGKGNDPDGYRIELIDRS